MGTSGRLSQGMSAIEWRAVVGFEDLYEISSDGQVRSLPRKGGLNRLYGGRILRASKGKSVSFPEGGYFEVGLSKNGCMYTKRVHRLVAEAFLGPCPKGQQVRHGSLGIHVNTVDNLCYGSQAENMRDKDRDGTQLLGSAHPQAKLTEESASDILKKISLGIEQQSLAREYGVSKSTVTGLKMGRTWKHIPRPLKLYT